LKIKTIFLLSIILLSLFVFYSCKEADVLDTDSIPIVDQTVDISDGAFLHLNIPEGKIYNTAVNLEYTLVGDWSDTVECDGAIEVTDLNIGDHVIVRGISDNTWIRDLGTVEALSGLPDFIPGNALYIGTGNFSDVIFAEPGEVLNILSYMNNYGESFFGVDTFDISFYISDDQYITAGDTSLGIYEYLWNVPSGEFYCTSGTDLTFSVPTLDPGTYYIGAIMDSSSLVNELNEGNNTTFPEDVATLIIQDNSALAAGAVKIVNSWGTGSWQEKQGDGHYWMPYSVMKDNNMGIIYYKNNFLNGYSPKVIATFELDHPLRDECLVSIGLGDPDNPFLEKSLESSWGNNNLLGGSFPFPDNLIVIDITEFAYAINNSNIFLKIDNLSSTAGNLDQFKIEFYSDYSSTAFKTISGGTGRFLANETTTSFAITLSSLTRGELLSISPPLSSTSYSNLVFYEDSPDPVELEIDKKSFGVYVPGTNYNKLYLGKYGTGYAPPSEEYWINVKKLRGIDNSLTRATFDGNVIPDVIDNSTSIYFPPIGNQGQEGSCAAFSVGYYVQTYTEAKEHNWDLSSTFWMNDSTGLSSGGRPNSNLDKIFSPDFLYHQINSGVDNGSFMGDAAALIIRLGGATWSTMPYDTSDSTTWPEEAAWREAPNYRGEKISDLYWDNDLSGYFTISTDADIQLLKALLAQGYIVSTSIHTDTVYGSFSSEDVVADGTSWTSTDHAQTIVGYKEAAEWNASSPDL
jgi:hypothetical protein